MGRDGACQSHTTSRAGRTGVFWRFPPVLKEAWFDGKKVPDIHELVFAASVDDASGAATVV